MSFQNFKDYLFEQGANLTQVYRLDRLARESASDAHSYLLGEGMTHNNFHSFCVGIGRDFVVENFGFLFDVDGYIK